MMKKLLFLLFFCVFVFFGKSQGSLVGEWRTHSSFENTSHVVVLNNFVYASSSFGLVVFNKEDNRVSYLTKVNGLSGHGITCVAANKKENLVLVGYSNGNIDLIKEGLVINFPHLMLSPSLGDKSLMGAFESDSFLYLTAPFGVVVFDCHKIEIKNTYVFDNQHFSAFVNGVSVLNDSIFVATNKGVFWGSLQENLLNHNNWHPVPGLPVGGNISSVVAFNGRLFCNFSSPFFNEDSVFVINNAVASFFDFGDTYTNRSISVSNNHLVLSNYFSVRVFDSLLNLVHNKSSLNPSFAFWDNGVLWVADKEVGLVKNWDGWKTLSFVKNGFASSFVSEISTKDSLVLISPGAINSSWVNLFLKDGVWSYKKEWVETSYEDLFFGHDVVCAVPYAGGFYCGSWGKGLFFVDREGVVSSFNENNSSLSSISSLGANGVRVGGLCFDSFNNL